MPKNPHTKRSAKPKKKRALKQKVKDDLVSQGEKPAAVAPAQAERRSSTNKESSRKQVASATYTYVFSDLKRTVIIAL